MDDGKLDSNALRTSTSGCIDVVLCIDATASMAPVMEVVKRMALDLPFDLLHKMKGFLNLDMMLRVRVISFRDIYLDDVPFEVSEFFSIPEERADFETFVGGISAAGTGEDPESGLEALALGLNSEWSPRYLRNRHVVVVWTDAPAHAVACNSGRVPMALASQIPSTMGEMAKMWDGRPKTAILPWARRLVLFAPEAYPWTNLCRDWSEVIHVPSAAGEGLTKFEYSEILDLLAQELEPELPETTERPRSPTRPPLPSDAASRWGQEREFERNTRTKRDETNTREEPVSSQSGGEDHRVDMILCIDASEGMSRHIEAVKATAVQMPFHLRDVFRDFGIHARLRIKVIAFRDMYTDASPFGISGFFVMPDQREQFNSFVSKIEPQGCLNGLPSGLEALALAAQSDWCGRGPGNLLRHVVVLWTDAPAHPLDGHAGCVPAAFAHNVPSTLAGLEELWADRSRYMVLLAPDAFPWGTIGAGWENVIWFPSAAGEGLSTSEYDEILNSLFRSH